MEAGNNIALNGTAESAISGGLLELIANEDGIGGGDLYAAGSLYGNMLLVGYDVTVDGMVISDSTLEVYAENNIQLNDTVSSEDAMTMEAGNNIALNGTAESAISGGLLELIANEDALRQRYVAGRL
jgi:hypothetical protein